MLELNDVIVELYSRNKHKSTSAAKIARLIWRMWEDKAKLTWYLEVPLIRSFRVKTTKCYNDHFDDELFFHLICFSLFSEVPLGFIGCSVSFKSLGGFCRVQRAEYCTTS